MKILSKIKPSRRQMENRYVMARMRSLCKEETKNVKKRLASINGGYNGSKKEFNDKVLTYWKRYNQKPQKYWFDLYCNNLDSYDPRYIPDTIYYNKIIPYFNYIAINKAYRDKGMFSRLLPDVKKPETIVKNIAGQFYNGDLDQPITAEKAMQLCEAEEHLIIKPSIASGSGRSITFFDRDDPKTQTISAIFSKFQANFVVQRLVQQHPDLARINNGSSLNTVRVFSFYFEEEVHILSTILRMGSMNSRIDNISAGGISCVIKPDGWLVDKAVNRKSKWMDAHESGIKFCDICVPSFQRIIEKVKRLHPMLPYFGIIGWDFAVDSEGEPVLIEYNLIPEQNQISCGPTFGDLSEKVLDDVFLNRTRKKYFY